MDPACSRVTVSGLEDGRPQIAPILRRRGVLDHGVALLPELAAVALETELANPRRQLLGDLARGSRRTALEPVEDVRETVQVAGRDAFAGAIDQIVVGAALGARGKRRRHVGRLLATVVVPGEVVAEAPARQQPEVAVDRVANATPERARRKHAEQAGDGRPGQRGDAWRRVLQEGHGDHAEQHRQPYRGAHDVEHQHRTRHDTPPSLEHLREIHAVSPLVLLDRVRFRESTVAPSSASPRVSPGARTPEGSSRRSHS